MQIYVAHLLVDAEQFSSGSSWWHVIRLHKTPLIQEVIRRHSSVSSGLEGVKWQHIIKLQGRIELCRNDFVSDTGTLELCPTRTAQVVNTDGCMPALLRDPCHLQGWMGTILLLTPSNYPKPHSWSAWPLLPPNLQDFPPDDTQTSRQPHKTHVYVFIFHPNLCWALKSASGTCWPVLGSGVLLWSNEKERVRAQTSATQHKWIKHEQYTTRALRFWYLLNKNFRLYVEFCLQESSQGDNRNVSVYAAQ